MEFAAYNDFDSEKENKAEKKLAVPLPHVETPPNEGVIFESHPRLPAPLFESLINKDEPKPEKGASEHYASDDIPEDLLGKPLAAEAPHAQDLHIEQPKLAEQRTEAKDESEDDEESETKPKKRAAAVSVPAHPAPVQPQVEQSPSLQEQFSELLEEMNQAAKAETATAEPVETTPEPTPPAAEHLQTPPPQPAGEYQPWHLPYTPPHEARPAPPAPPSASGSGGGRPPLPPRPPMEAAGFGYSPEPTPEPSFAPAAEARPAWMAAQQQFNMLHTPAQGMATARAEQASADPAAINQAEYYAEKRGLRRGLVAGFITGYALKQFLANRKMHRFQATTEKQLNKRDEQIDELTRRQRDYQERLAAQQGRYEQLARQQAERAVQQGTNQPSFEHAPAATPLQARFEQSQTTQPNATPSVSAGMERRPTQPPVAPEVASKQAVSPEEAAQQAVAEAYDLKPQQHIERSAWHNIVVDEKGHEVQGAMHYGEAFRRERQKEQVRENVFAGGASNQAQAGTAVGGGMYPPAAGYGQQLDSGQITSPYDLPPGQADVQHRLQKPGNPVVSTLSSPWLWAGIVVLLAAFFVAALI